MAQTKEGRLLSGESERYSLELVSLSYKLDLASSQMEPESPPAGSYDLRKAAAVAENAGRLAIEAGTRALQVAESFRVLAEVDDAT